MRILVVHNFYQLYGGEDAVVKNDVALLTAAGETVALHSVSNSTIDGPLRVALAWVQCIYNSQAKRALVRKIREFNPDIVHVHNFFPLLSPSILDACVQCHVPVVMTLHNFRIICPSATLYFDGAQVTRSVRHSAWWTVPKRVYRNSFFATLAVAAMIEFHKARGTWERKVDRFIALSQFANRIFQEWRLPAARMVVKGNWAWPTDTNNRQPPGPGGALFVGRLSDEKGITTLIESWRELQFSLTIAGDGPMMEWLRSQVNPRLRLLGRVEPDAVRREMAGASFLILPSLCSEMFPVTLAEAYSSGLPVIVSDTGSLGEMVEHGVTGLRFPPGDAASLSQTIKWALINPDAMVQMGRNARQRYEQKYSPEVGLAELLEVYRSVIEERGNRSPAE